MLDNILYFGTQCGDHAPIYISVLLTLLFLENIYTNKVILTYYYFAAVLILFS